MAKKQKIYNLHLVSDATGETLETMAKAALVQFEGVDCEKYFWPMIRSVKQMKNALDDIKQNPGLVMFTLVDNDVRNLLISTCKKEGLPMVSILDPLIEGLAAYFQQQATHVPGRQYVLDREYFNRIEALQFSMNHDDGQLTTDLMDADLILVGVSRTSKTPTSIYLANRGIRTANIPFIQGCPMPAELDEPGKTMMIGLTASPERLVQIRTNRLRAINQDADTDYVDLEAIKAEVAACRRFCNERKWPVIDVTRRSIEETAAAILTLYHDFRQTEGARL